VPAFHRRLFAPYVQPAATRYFPRPVIPTPEPPSRLPTIIQGGMGIAVSNWRLARAIAQAGQLGVISGTALASVLVRRLQDGDADGALRRALAQCPLREAADRIVTRYWIEGGRPAGQPYRLTPLPAIDSPRELTELTIAANFAEVFLAKEGHGGLVGVNLLEKIQLPTLASLFGAMLAGVDFVLMGAGIPRAIPGVLDGLAAGQAVSLRLAVEGAGPDREHILTLDPADFLPRPVTLARPRFLAIVASSTLALTLARKSSGRVDGFVVEGVAAGGHNAPPRGTAQFNARGEPVYGPRDHADLAAIRALGLPFWLAGSYAHPEKLRAALAAGATGVQVGTAFALCEESGLTAGLKRSALAHSVAGTIDLLTDARASPTGMPFKVVRLEHTVADPAVYAQRARACDLGYLRQPYQRADGSVGYRCPAEPEADFVRKGGDPADTVGRKCLCNGLLSAIGLGQGLAAGQTEPAIVTAGEDIAEAKRFLAPGRETYSAADVLAFMEA
jgi:nitronate monooxygenase